MNYLIINSDTAVSEIEDCFKRFVKRDDIDIILINQNVAELIRHVIDGHTQPIPAVLEIPSKDHPYDASKDSILRRAKVSYLTNFLTKSVSHIFFRACLILRIWFVEYLQFHQVLVQNKIYVFKQ